MSQNISERIKTHNRGKVKSTKGHRPFELIYKEKTGSREEARKREKYLKSTVGRKFIKKIIMEREKDSLPLRSSSDKRTTKDGYPTIPSAGRVVLRVL